MRNFISKTEVTPYIKGFSALRISAFRDLKDQRNVVYKDGNLGVMYVSLCMYVIQINEPSYT